MSQQNSQEKTSDVRCKMCGHLLFRLVGSHADGNVEIKCKKCSRVCNIRLQVKPNFNKMNLPQAA